MTPVPRPRRRSAWFLALLGVLLVGAGLIGAYLDWAWWHPERTIVITLAAIGLLLLAAILFVIRPGVLRSIGLSVAAVGAGLILGQLVGPGRELPAHSSGTMTVRLTGPIASVATGPADCATVPGGDQLQVEGDPNTRLPLAGRATQEYPFISASVASGDMWARESGRRSDELIVIVYLNAAVIPADGAPTEAWLESGPDSTLEAQIADNSGSMRFSGLALRSGGATEPILGTRGEVTGTIEWTCPGT